MVIVVVQGFSSGDALMADESCLRRRPWRIFEPSRPFSRKISLTSQADVSDPGSAIKHKEMAMLLYKSMRNYWERRSRDAVLQKFLCRSSRPWHSCHQDPCYRICTIARRTCRAKRSYQSSRLVLHGCCHRTCTCQLLRSSRRSNSVSSLESSCFTRLRSFWLCCIC